MNKFGVSVNKTRETERRVTVPGTGTRETRVNFNQSEKDGER